MRHSWLTLLSITLGEGHINLIIIEIIMSLHRIAHKRFTFFIILFLHVCGYAQVPKFYNVKDIQEYLSSNIQTLDPLEGFWEGTWTRNTNSPYAQPDGSETYWILVKGSDGWIYNLDGNFKPKTRGIRFRRIGETNIYKWELLTSSGIVTIDSPYSINIRFDVNSSDAKVWAGNKNFIWNLWLVFRMAKDYPTSTMYTNAIRSDDKSTNSNSQLNNIWSGSGFALKGGYLVTNYHIIEGAKSITIQGVNGTFDKSFNATIIGTDKNNDLALLKITDSSFVDFGIIPYTITSTTSDVGEDIFVLGYPLTSTMGDEIKLTTGIISSKTGFQGDVALYQISAPIQPGNSGCPLFDKKGNVIGIVSAKHAGAENVGYAIKSVYLRNLIESCADISIIPTTNTVATLPLTGKVKKEKNFVFLIKCSSD